MKKLFTIILAATLSLTLFAGCKEDEPVNETPDDKMEQTNPSDENKQTITTLEGKWVGYDELGSTERWIHRYEAIIKNGTMEIKQASNAFPYPDDIILWWRGNYAEPTEEVSEYSFESIKNIPREESISGQCADYPKKIFKYSDGKIIFLECDAFEHDSVTNPYIYLEKVED